MAAQLQFKDIKEILSKKALPLLTRDVPEPSSPGDVRVGCSGWQYAHWRGSFYPAAMPQREWLRHYTSVFDTVEINNTFYRLPEASTFAAWRRRTPDDFVIAIKASRYLTHLKKLRDPAEPVARLFDRARHLGSRLGPVLYQLPANFRRDLDRLRDVLATLPRTLRAGRGSCPVRHAFEFRDPSWYDPATFALLARYGVAVCLHDKAGSSIRDQVTAPFVYIRFHGPGGTYSGSYDDEALTGWAVWIRREAAAGRDVYAYFNNDPQAAAVRNARSLRAKIRPVQSVIRSDRS
jgi:uncharacterized protein YecE (DUF72 family)